MNLEVMAVMQEVESGRSWKVLLLPAAPPCAPAPQVAPAVQSTSHTTGRRALVGLEQTDLPAVLWSVWIKYKLSDSMIARHNLCSNSKTSSCSLEMQLSKHSKIWITPGWVCGVIVHPLCSSSPSFGISRVIFSPSNTTSWSGPILVSALAYLASTACSTQYRHKHQLEIKPIISEIFRVLTAMCNCKSHIIAM